MVFSAGALPLALLLPVVQAPTTALRTVVGAYTEYFFSSTPEHVVSTFSLGTIGTPAVVTWTTVLGFFSLAEFFRSM